MYPLCRVWERSRVGTMTTYTDKVTLIGPRPYGGTYTSVTTDPSVHRLVAAGHKIMRVWTVKVNADGTRESLALN